jgi:predicted DNA-binding transcriptional regulator YafY
MKRLERIYELNRILLTRRTPVSHQDLEQGLQCSRATVDRVIADLRDLFGAPVEHSPEQKGYRYRGRGSAEETARSVSPQRLTHYRDNWYLDAWCHRREALRSFALERIASLAITDDPAREISEEALDAHFAHGYGIFAGPPRHTAVLRFTPERARWVAEENWFPGQPGEFLDDGSYLLRLPYSEAPELVMDILKYGPDVEVLEPVELREEVKERLRLALGRYGAEEEIGGKLRI